MDNSARLTNNVATTRSRFGKLVSLTPPKLEIMGGGCALSLLFKKQAPSAPAALNIFVQLDYGIVSGLPTRKPFVYIGFTPLI